MTNVDEPAKYDVGLPAGTAALALALAGHAAQQGELATAQPHRVDQEATLAHLLLPLLVGETQASESPRVAIGGGLFHADLLAEDEALLGAIVGAASRPDAEEVANAAQTCRLPVTPYRSATPWRSAEVRATPPSSRARRVQPGAVRVVDMTAMWAGPLCTMLLAAWGAEVVTIEPTCRRDGMRGSPRQFRVLDTGKSRLPLDLRRTDDRLRFEQLVGAADVLVESFSRRVMSNLGYDTDRLRRINPRLVTVAIRAFDRGTDESDWVAYGRGVHAASGLGLIEGCAQEPLVAYPDPLTGLAAFAAVLEGLGHDDEVEPVEVSLAGTIAPLRTENAAPLSTGDPAAIRRLRRATGRPPRCG